MSRLVALALAMIPAAFGIPMLLAPVRFSRFLYWLEAPQRELLRGGSLFDWSWPDRVEQSRPLRTQIRVVVGIFLAVTAVLMLSK